MLDREGTASFTHGGSLFFMNADSLVSPLNGEFTLSVSALFLGAGLLTLGLWDHIPGDLRRWSRFSLYVCSGALASLTTAYILSCVGQSLELRGRIFLCSLALFAPAVYAVGGRPTEHFLDSVWSAFVLVPCLYAWVCLIRYCLKNRTAAPLWLFVQWSLCLAAAVHDYFVLNGYLARWAEEPYAQWRWNLLTAPVYLSPPGLPLLFLLMGRTNFNKMVQLREAVIVRALNQQKNAAVIEAVRNERDRIYQDVHDGIGSQLVKAIYCLNRHGQALDGVVHNLQACLNDLRLVINAHQNDRIDIQSAVFAFCVAQESHLEGAGLAISYDIGYEATFFSESTVCLNILRILQESIANTIKHSTASEISIQVREEGNELILLITDNGGPHLPNIRNVQKNLYGGSGHVGLNALARRAEAIGARHHVTIAETGTEIRISVPLPKVRPLPS